MRGSFFGLGVKANYTLFSQELQSAAPARHLEWIKASGVQLTA